MTIFNKKTKSNKVHRIMMALTALALVASAGYPLAVSAVQYFTAIQVISREEGFFTDPVLLSVPHVPKGSAYIWLPNKRNNAVENGYDGVTTFTSSQYTANLEPGNFVYAGFGGMQITNNGAYSALSATDLPAVSVPPYYTTYAFVYVEGPIGGVTKNCLIKLKVTVASGGMMTLGSEFISNTANCTVLYNNIVSGASDVFLIIY